MIINNGDGPMSNLKASYRRHPENDDRWEGVLKDEHGKVVWACGHKHENRDYNHSAIYHHLGAARYCSRDELERRNAEASQSAA